MKAKALPTIAGMVGALTACGADDVSSREGARAYPEPGSITCERKADTQATCLAKTYLAENCAEADVLGTMYRHNEKLGTFDYRIAFDANAKCLSELQRAADELEFSQGDERRSSYESQAKTRKGYSETLIFAASDAEGGMVEWERIQQ